MSLPEPAAPRRRSLLRRLGFLALFLGLLAFVVFNVMTFAEAWGMTHYQPAELRTTHVRELNTWGWMRFLFIGPTVRRMQNTSTPEQHGLVFTTKQIRNARGQKLEVWCIPARADRPLVLMFPGYGGSKDTLLAAAGEFNRLGCETWLVDFAGIGGSDGNVTTIGWREADDVAAVAQAARAAQPARPLVLYGTSMGSVAILRALHLGAAPADALVLECPYDRLVATINNRCEMLGLPGSIFAPAVVFWAGVQNGFNGFRLNPVDYARDVHCPALLLQGADDEFVGLSHARRIAAALGEHGTFKVLPAGHGFMVVQAAPVWRASVKGFLEEKVPAAARSAARSKSNRSS